MNSFCPLCKNQDSKIIGKSRVNLISKEFIDKEYNVVQCNNCSIYFVLPQISFNEEQWAKLYNAEYFADQSEWLNRKRTEELSQRFDKAVSFLGDKNRIHFLDIGAGEGKSLIEGMNRGWEVTGIDIVDNRIKSAQSNKIKFIADKFLDYDFPENSFDFIYLDSVLEHVLQPKEYLHKINRILKDKGVVYIGVPNEDCLFNDIRKIVFILLGKNKISTKIKPFDSPYHVIGFNSKSLNCIVDTTRFKIKLLRNFGRKFDFLGSSPTKKAFWIGLVFLLPIEFIGNLINRDVYYEVYLTKQITN